MNSRWMRVAIAGLVVSGGTCLWVSPSLKAQSESDFEQRNEGVRLTYNGASWEQVLEDFSQQVGRRLVMDSVPKGKVTRRDRTVYSTSEALRLLNSELGKDGYRVLMQQDLVILTKADQTPSRSRQRPSTQRPIRNRSTARAAYSGQGTAQRQIRQTSSFQEAMNGVPVSRADGPWEEQTFKVANAQAADVARSIYDVFAKRSTLNTSGVNGLPSFTVFHRDAIGRTSKNRHFEIGIDRERNSLTVAAPANTIRQLVNLIRELDQTVQDKRDVRVVQTQNLKAKTTEELQQELDRLSRLTRTSFQPNRGNMFFAQGGQDGGQPQPGSPQAGAGDQKAMNLQGDVVLQPLDDIGAVVIKGNQDDIDTVVGIIEELERLSEGTLPEVSLVELNSVNSEALAELLTTVYENLSELREGGSGTERKNNIGFVPVVKPNAILVLAPRIDLEQDIKKLIEKLDRPVNPTFEFEVFQLRNAIASQVKANLDTLYEEPVGLGTRIRSVADVRTNSLIVQARPADLEEVAAIVEKVDRDESKKRNRLKVIPLRNASAEELAETISTAIQNIINPPQTNVNFGQTGASELRDSQSVVLEFFTRDGDVERLIRSGILVDVRVQADIRSNSLIVTAPEPSLELMEALIRQLDGAPPSVADIKVFTLERADATQAVELLTGLFEDQNNEDEVGVAFAGANAADSTLVPVRFSADIRTNTVVAAGSLESLAIVEAILLRLDEPQTSTRSREPRVVQLNNIEAESAAERLTAFLEARAELLDADDLRSGIERLQNEVVIDFEVQSNSLIISATPEWHARMKTIIDQLDADPRQVVIQALLVEVTLENNDEFGIELGFQDPFSFLRGNSGFNFAAANQLANTNLVSPDRIVTQGLNNLGLGRTSTNAGVGGFVFSANSEAVSVLVRALQARRNVQVLSRPMINARNGILARIQVGQDVPVVNGFAASGLGNLQPTVERDDAGVILEVTPRISENDTVQLRVYAEKSDFAGGTVVLGTDANGGAIEAPIKDISVAEGDIVLRNGQTAVFGGIISKSDDSIERKVPWLGDIPWLGQAFRFDATETNRSELLIFLTPRIVKSDGDVEILKQIEADRIHYIESEAENIHGPLFSVPNEGGQNGTHPQGLEGLPADQFIPANEPVEIIQPASATEEKSRKRGFLFGRNRGRFSGNLKGK